MSAPVTLRLDEKELEPAFRHVKAGTTLHAAVKPRAEWSDAECADAASAKIWVFQTPISAYQELEDATSQFEGQMTRMNDVLSLTSRVDSVQLELLPDTYYDVFCMGFRNDGAGFIFAGSRFATDESESSVPASLTLDEAK